MAKQGKQGRVSVNTTSAPPGGSVQVTGAPDGTVLVRVPGEIKEPERIRLDKNGKATISVPPIATDEFIIMSAEFPHGWVAISVVRPQSGSPSHNIATDR
jgi:hypothetical protein